MGWKTKIVPKTTNNTTKGIINFLESKGHAAWRVNVEGQYDEFQETWRRSGATKGVLDVGCCLCPIGVLLVVDIKRPGDVKRDDQKKYAKNVQRCGGFAYFTKDLVEFMGYYYTIIEPALNR